MGCYFSHRFAGLAPYPGHLTNGNLAQNKQSTGLKLIPYQATNEPQLSELANLGH